MYSPVGAARVRGEASIDVLQELTRLIILAVNDVGLARNFAGAAFAIRHEGVAGGQRRDEHDVLVRHAELGVESVRLLDDRRRDGVIGRARENIDAIAYHVRDWIDLSFFGSLLGFSRQLGGIADAEGAKESSMQPLTALLRFKIDVSRPGTCRRKCSRSSRKVRRQ